MPTPHANIATPAAMSAMLLLPAAALALCFMAGWAPVADGDIFWHLAAGREMWQRGSWLTHDPFSISAGGRPWIDVHWLFQLAAYATHSVSGLSGLVLAKCAVTAASALVILYGLPRSARATYVLLLAVTLLFARQLLLVRPVIVSLLCLSIFWVLLERHRTHADRRALWLLLPVQALWTNCQGLSALGPAVIGTYAVAALVQRREARTLVAALGGSLCASLASPFGFQALQLPLQLFQRLLPNANSPYQNIAENIPPLSAAANGEFWHLPWFLLLLAALMALRARRIPLSHLLLLAGFVVLALLSNRNVLLLYFIAAPIIALHSPKLSAVATSSALAPVVALLLIAAIREPAIAQPTPFHFPTQSARAIAAHGGQGNIFCADAHGGYFIWQLYPAFRPYVDTRWILRSPDELRDYLQLADHPERFHAFAKQHDFAYVALPVSYPDRYLGLISELYASPGWQLVQTDGAQVLFARSDLVAREGAWDLYESATTDRVLGELDARYGAQPRLHAAARVQLASLQLAVGAFVQAQRVLDAPSLQSAPEALSLRARAHLLAGELDPARRLAERMLRERPDDVRTLDLMAQVWLRGGQPTRALSLLRRAVEIDPFDAEATSLLTNLEVRP